MVKKGLFDLSGKVALITGGGSGLGQAFCQAMAEYGADIACAGRTLSKLEQTVDLVRPYGHRAIAVKTDVSKEDEIENMVDRVIKELGRLDIVFCNAATSIPFTRIHEVAVEDWDTLMELNLRGVFLLMRASLRHMVRQQSGCIINTASIAGVSASGESRGVTNIAAYSATKAGVIALTRHAAMEYGKDGIRVNAIAPGFHVTEMVSEDREALKELTELHVRNTALGRVGVPEDIKGLAVWLASDASGYVTGQVIVQDGGMIL